MSRSLHFRARGRFLLVSTVMAARTLPTPFFYRLMGAATLDTGVYEEVEGDQSATVQAFCIVLLSSLAAGIGIGGLSAASVGYIAAVALITWAAARVRRAAGLHDSGVCSRRRVDDGRHGGRHPSSARLRQHDARDSRLYRGMAARDGIRSWPGPRVWTNPVLTPARPRPRSRQGANPARNPDLKCLGYDLRDARSRF
jgi:hypothetical protein